jgi:hypothetical protein
MRSPEMGMGAPEAPKVENIDQYEREKIETTLKDAKHLVAVIENYLKTVAYCDEKGIELPNRKSLDAIRRPGELADPVGALTKLSILFESGMSDMAKNINVSHKDELEKRYNS